MVKVNYEQICSNLLRGLPLRQKEIILRRFALKKGEKETLDSIGRDFNVTRERIRQIERDAFLTLKPELKKYQKVFKYFEQSLRETGNLRKEDSFLSALGDEKFQNQIYFLLTLGGNFERVGETRDFYSLWTINSASWISAQKAISVIYEKLQRTGKPLQIKEIPLVFYLEVSKKIQKNAKGLFGLKDWPEINPRRIKDKAYFALKESQKPLHFTQVAELIDSISRTLVGEGEEKKFSLTSRALAKGEEEKKFSLTSQASARGGEEKKFSSTLPQTVHNELIKDPRFVLVGRGIYALKEWGYEEGQVKDVILNILKTAGRPLKKEEVLEKTLEQRLVKKNTVFLNLNNKKYFSRNSEGRYIIKEA